MWYGIRRALILIVGTLLVLGITPVAAADGDEAVNLSIRPVGTSDNYFTLTAEPGDVFDLEVELANHGNSPISVQTYAADAYSLINGGFGVKLADELTSGTTEWINYPVETFELDARTSTIRSVKVEIPTDAKPGQYLSALTIQNAVPTAATGEGVGFKQINRQAIAVAIELPGKAMPGLELGTVTHKFAGVNSVILIDVANTGNRHMKLAGDIVIIGPDGSEVLARPVSTETVYAGTSTQLEIPVKAALASGEYQVALNLGNETLNVSEKLEFAPVTVPDAPAAPAPANPETDAVDGSGVEVPAPVSEEQAKPGPATEAVPAAQTGIEAWMLFAGIAAALVFGAGGAFLGFTLMRDRNGKNVSISPTPATSVSTPATTHAPVSGAAEPTLTRRPEPTAERMIVDPVKPRQRPVFQKRPSTAVRNLLQATSAIRNEMAATNGLQEKDQRS